MGFGVSGFGFGAWGLGLGAWGLGVGIPRLQASSVPPQTFPTSLNDAKPESLLSNASLVVQYIYIYIHGFTLRLNDQKGLLRIVLLVFPFVVSYDIRIL